MRLSLWERDGSFESFVTPIIHLMGHLFTGGFSGWTNGLYNEELGPHVELRYSHP